MAYVGTIPYNYARYVHKLEEKVLDQLPFVWRARHPKAWNKSWYKVLWARDVLEIVDAIRVKKEKAEELRQEREQKAAEEKQVRLGEKRDAIFESYRGERKLLKRAVAAVEQELYPVSPTLSKLHAGIFNSTEDMEDPAEVDKFVEYYEDLTETVKKVNKALKKAGMDSKEHAVPLDEKVDADNPRSRKIWIDSLISKTVSLAKYIAAAAKAVETNANREEGAVREKDDEDAAADGDGDEEMLDPAEDNVNQDEVSASADQLQTEYVDAAKTEVIDEDHAHSPEDVA